MQALLFFGTMTFAYQLCLGHPPVENLPVQVNADCSFAHAGKEHPISAGPAYRLENGFVAQTITHREDEPCRYETTLVVDCANEESILIPNSGAISGFESGVLTGEGPPLPHFLSDDERQSISKIATVFGEVRVSFMSRLRADEGGAGPDAFCGCRLPHLSKGRE